MSTEKASDARAAVKRADPFGPRPETVKAKQYARVRSALRTAYEECKEACPDNAAREGALRMIEEAVTKFDEAITAG